MTSWLVEALLRWGWRTVWWLSSVIAAGSLLFVFRYPFVTVWTFAALALATPIAYGFFRAYLKRLTSRSSLGRIPIWYTVAVLYLGVAAVPISLIVLPLQWRAIGTDEMNLGLLLGGIPSGLGVAVAAARTLDDCRLVA